MSEEELLNFINITDDLVIIDKEEFFKKVLNPCMEIAVNKHKQLISFLEDKIKKYDDAIDITKSDLQEAQFTFNSKKALEDTIKEYELIKKIFQEVLDFVKGGKDE